MKAHLGEQIVVNKIETGVITPTHDYVDGKQVYVKRINLGNLPNSTYKDVLIGETNIEIIEIKGLTKPSSSQYNPLPTISSSGVNYSVEIFVRENGGQFYVRINTRADRSDWTGIAYVYFTYK